MRTTLMIDDELYRAAKSRAASTGRTVSAFVEDALRMALAIRDELDRVQIGELPTYGDGDVHSGIDLTDNADLRDQMDRGTPLDAMR